MRIPEQTVRNHLALGKKTGSGFYDYPRETAKSLNIIEQLHVPFSGAEDKPVMFPIEWTFVSLWRRDVLEEPEKAVGRFRILGPSGLQLAVAQFEIDLSKHQRSRNLSQQNGLLVEKIGTHRFVVEIQNEDDSWDFLADVPLEISRIVDSD